MKGILSSLLKSSAWGIGRPRSAERAATGKRVQVYRRKRADPPELVGELSLDEGEYVFRYVPGYSGAPISAFPETTKRYRAEVLWPFFEIRIPPVSRKDVQEVMEAEKIDRNDAFEMLARLGRLSVANAYELRLVGES